jgi:hypothetical protein
LDEKSIGTKKKKRVSVVFIFLKNIHSPYFHC